MWETYSYAGESPSSHVLEQREIWRKTFIPNGRQSACGGRKEKRQIRFLCTYSYSSADSVVGWAIGATPARDPPPSALDCKARVPISLEKLGWKERQYGVELQQYYSTKQPMAQFDDEGV
jgi:hypothetical protein